MINIDKQINLFEESLLKNIARRLGRGSIRIQNGLFETPMSLEKKRDEHTGKLKHFSHLLYPEKF